MAEEDDDIGTVGVVARELASALQPLEDHLTADGILLLFEELGIQLPEDLVGKQGVSTALPTGRAAVQKLPQLVTALSSSANQGLPAILEALRNLLDALGAVFTALDSLATAIKDIANELPGVSPGDVVAFAELLVGRLLEYLVVLYLEGNFPRLAAFLAVVGVIEIGAARDATDAVHPAYLRRSLRFDNLPKLLRTPDVFMRDEYGWGSPSFDGVLLLSRISDLLYAFAVPADFVPARTGKPPRLDVLLFSLSPETTAPPLPATPGLIAKLVLGLQETFTLQFPFFVDGWNFEVATTGKLDAGLTATIRSPGNLSLKPPSGTLNGSVSVGVVGERPDATHPNPFQIVRIPGVGRIEAGRVRARVGAEYHFDSVQNVATGDPLVELRIEDGRLAFGSDSGDGFLQKVLPGSGVSLDFDFGVGWSGARGVFFTGAAGIETTLVIDADVGPLHIDSLHLKAVVDPAGLDLETSLTGVVEIGPVSASIAEIGLTSRLAFSRGNLGPFDFGSKFKFPSGIGIDVAAGPVSGGGFLFIDEKAGRYAGALELSIYSMSVKAFGVIDTKISGHEGFSFAIVISAEFNPIQLGLGFTLNGVGGIIGINRSIDADALRSAVRTGSLENLLFPHDLIHDAPQIIHDLQAVLPATDGRYIFGPMAKIGWGTPTIIDAELGIILELPGWRLALLGEVHALLPRKDKAIVKLNLSVAGLLDFPKKVFEIDASLHDSQVGSYPITGDMAMRLLWGDNPSFALAVGGFHPAYQPPPGFPTLRRVAVDLGVSGNPSLTLQGYFAITSNSVQTGALAELKASGDGIDLYGRVQFDAILIFSPFSFEVSLSASVRVSFHGHGIGVHLSGVLSGPSPWRVRGEVCVSILFWDACLSFDKSFGSAQRVAIPAVDPWSGAFATGDPTPEVPGLQKALTDVRNWTPELPPAAFSVVSLVSQSTDLAPPLDPLGIAVVRQRVCPLNLELTRFGSATVKERVTFNVKSSTINGKNTGTITYSKEPFAKAQFVDMTDAQKLSAPSFEPFDAAIRVPANDNSILSGSQKQKDIKYTTKILGQDISTDHNLPLEHLLGMSRRSATGLAGLRRAGAEGYLDPTALARFGVTAELFVIADRATFKTTSILANAATKFEASLALTKHLADHPEDEGTLQVVPKFELGAR